MTSYHEIETQINDMMAVQAAGHIKRHVNRVVVGYSVNLGRDGYFMVGCDLFRSNSGMRVAEWLFERSLGTPLQVR